MLQSKANLLFCILNLNTAPAISPLQFLPLLEQFHQYMALIKGKGKEKEKRRKKKERK